MVIATERGTLLATSVRALVKIPMAIKSLPEDGFNSRNKSPSATCRKHFIEGCDVYGTYFFLFNSSFDN